jgi:hypothetical protein
LGRSDAARARTAIVSLSALGSINPLDRLEPAQDIDDLAVAAETVVLQQNDIALKSREIRADAGDLGPYLGTLVDNATDLLGEARDRLEMHGHLGPNALKLRQD